MLVMNSVQDISYFATLNRLSECKEGGTRMDMLESTQGSKQVPYLHKQGSATQLIVDDKPFLILGERLRCRGGSRECLLG